MTYEDCVSWKLQKYYKEEVQKLYESLATKGLDPTAGLSRQIMRMVLGDEYIGSCIREDSKKSFETIKQAFELILEMLDSVAIQCEKECNELGGITHK